MLHTATGMQLRAFLKQIKPSSEPAFQAAVKARVSALITVRDAVFHRYQKQIADLAIKNRLPSMFERSDYVEAGGLVSY